jgi:hypothetical protein
MEITVSRMWNVGTRVVPVIIGALGRIKKGLDQNLIRSQSTQDMLSKALEMGVSKGALLLGKMDGCFFPRAFKRRKKFLDLGKLFMRNLRDM